MQETVNVVNDCSHVMEELIPFLSGEFKVNFVGRSRGWWSKTFGLGWKILRLPSGLVHVNYALEDAWLASKFKRLDVLYCHGSDVRSTVNDTFLGWIVKSNLRSARRVLYSTLDLKPLVEKYRSDASYLPVPVDIARFKPSVKVHEGVLKAVYFRKWYEPQPNELFWLMNRYGISVDVVEPNLSYACMPDFLCWYGIYVDRFTIPSLSKTCLEAMSCELATVDFRHKDCLEERVAYLSERKHCSEAGFANRLFVMEEHDAPLVAEKLAEVWRGVAS